MSRWFKSPSVWSLMAVTLIATLAIAQQPQRSNTRNAPADKARAGQTGSRVDAQLAAWLIVDNEAEIALAELAQQKAESEEVKQFARTMQDEHTQYLSQLAPFAGDAHQSGDRTIEGQQPSRRTEGSRDDTDRARDDTDAQRRDAQRRDGQQQAGNDRPKATDARRPGEQATDSRGVDLVALKKELGEQCLQSVKQSLEEKQGAEFDKCYMAQQAMAHQQMLDTLEVFESHASTELQPVIQAGIETTRKHLEHAKELAKSAESRVASSN
jgi:predicted outer membrane protein